MTLRETYARDICQNPGVPLEDCPRRDEHYALVDERLAGLADELASGIKRLPAYRDAMWGPFFGAVNREVAADAIVAALEDRT